MLLCDVLLPVFCMQTANPSGNTSSIVRTLTQAKQLINGGRLVCSPKQDPLSDIYSAINMQPSPLISHYDILLIRSLAEVTFWKTFKRLLKWKKSYC